MRFICSRFLFCCQRWDYSTFCKTVKCFLLFFEKSYYLPFCGEKGTRKDTGVWQQNRRKSSQNRLVTGYLTQITRLFLVVRGSTMLWYKWKFVTWYNKKTGHREFETKGNVQPPLQNIHAIEPNMRIIASKGWFMWRVITFPWNSVSVLHFKNSIESQKIA